METRVMATNRIHLINPKSTTFISRPLIFGRSLYSPLAGLLAVAALLPERYEVVLTDENVEEIDFDLDADLVGISAMTSYVKRGYAIADRFRERGIPVLMGGVHPSFMPDEALTHADAVVIGEAELIMDRIIGDLERGRLSGVYKGDRLHPMTDMAMPRYELLKKNKYVTSTFIQTSRGCHHACTFCAEQLMYGLRFRYRPVDEVMREIDATGAKTIALNDADFFGTPSRAMEIMKALKGRGVRWQAGVNTAGAYDDELLDAAAESGCYMLAVGFESLSRETLRNQHKFQNTPEHYQAVVKKMHDRGIMVFGLFMFGFDQDDETVFDRTVDFNIAADYDVCAYSIMTPYPGTLTWYEMQRQGRVVSTDWDGYDQGHVVYKPIGLTPEVLRDGHGRAYDRFYSARSMLRRFPLTGGRSRLYWSIYNLFYGRLEASDRHSATTIAQPTEATTFRPQPPLMPQRADWRELILESEPGAGTR
jgi:radical SAM superfamily enzyme YgiQ (UPF0313 family)